MNPSRPPRTSLPLILSTATLLLAGIAERTWSEEILHIAIFGSESRAQLREELKRRAGTPELPNERATVKSPAGEFITDLHVHWQAPLIDGIATFDGLGTPPRGGPRKTLERGGVTIDVKKVEDDDDNANADADADANTAHLVFDIDTLQPALDKGYYRFRTSGLPVPIRPNAWVEVTDWGLPHQDNYPIFCYLETPQTKPASKPTTGEKKPDPQSDPESQPQPHPPQQLPFGNDPKAAWRLEAVYGSLSDELIQQIGQGDTKQAALAAETMGAFRYGIPCLSEKPFSIATGAGDEAKRKNDAYHERRLSKFEGTLSVYESSISLKCQFQPPVVRDEDARVIPFEGELRPGQWKFLPIPNGPDHASLGQFPGGPSIRLNVIPPMNAAAFRVTKLEVR